MLGALGVASNLTLYYKTRSDKEAHTRIQLKKFWIGECQNYESFSELSSESSFADLYSGGVGAGKFLKMVKFCHASRARPRRRVFRGVLVGLENRHPWSLEPGACLGRRLLRQGAGWVLS